MLAQTVPLKVTFPSYSKTITYISKVTVDMLVQWSCGCTRRLLPFQRLWLLRKYLLVLHKRQAVVSTYHAKLFNLTFFQCHNSFSLSWKITGDRLKAGPLLLSGCPPAWTVAHTHILPLCISLVSIVRQSPGHWLPYAALLHIKNSTLWTSEGEIETSSW